jgi:hypothetical protein
MIVRVPILRTLALGLALSLASPCTAFAWGPDGHRIIADIAEQYLKPAAARQVRALLAIENTATLADVSNWADEISPQRPETARWHYVDIPLDAAGYDAARDCPQNACVVAQIERFTGELSDARQPPRKRLEALKFLVHFVGDIHQPLHAANNNDRGGNDVKVSFDGRDTNLHLLWDIWLLAPAVNGDDRAYAMRLAHAITPAEAEAWANGSPADWANESHDIARRIVYGALPHEGALPATYAARALPVANEQLEKAGVRLANVLNGALK